MECRKCATCNGIVRRAFNDLAGLELGPKDAADLVRTLRILTSNLRAVS